MGPRTGNRGHVFSRGVLFDRLHDGLLSSSHNSVWLVVVLFPKLLPRRIFPLLISIPVVSILVTFYA
jgi:hypothetical protein